MRLKIGFVVVFHNSENYATRVLNNLLKSTKPGDFIVVVADGCTDTTINACRQTLARAECDFLLEETPDLHEIGALNFAFNLLKEHDTDFIMHIQGDMVIDYENFHILRSALEFNPRIGLLSLRMGGCFNSLEGEPQLKLLELEFGHNYKGTVKRRTHIYLSEYCVAGRGPLVINRDVLLHTNWKIDENLRPHSIDDIDLSLISTEIDLLNYTLNLPFRSDVTWGSTRSSTRSYKEPVNISAERNLRYVIDKHRNLIIKASEIHNHNKVYISEIRVGYYFLLGVFINKQLTSEVKGTGRRLMKKLAFTLSKYTV
jgi:glycosyltransferase involved in cell wall biosynthesis